MMTIRSITIFMLILILFLVTGCKENEQVVSSESVPIPSTSIPTVPATETATVPATETAVSPSNTAEPPIETPKSVRTLLTYEQLTTGFDAVLPLEETSFAMPEDAEQSEFIFEGRLELLNENSVGDVEVIRGDPDVEPDLPHLPQFDFSFVQSDDTLVPVQRGLIITDHPIWNYFIEPGRVWQEAGDEGYARASFPFALVPKGGNSTYNGTMTFLFNDDGISKVWYQITQETSFYFRANFWGLLDATYHPEAVTGADQIQAEFVRELADRFPTKPIEQLAVDYPGVDVSQFGANLSPDHLTAYGFVIDGVNYVSACHARYGRYTYCDSMRAPSWSTAKSAFA
ncbi:MAG: hypothetical protein GY805_01365, partial [Chloroflexi bacterium]|nr:hypothetical protein [Chloroflexota bacterium]